MHPSSPTKGRTPSPQYGGGSWCWTCSAPRWFNDITMSSPTSSAPPATAIQLSGLRRFGGVWETACCMEAVACVLKMPLPPSRWLPRRAGGSRKPCKVYRTGDQLVRRRQSPDGPSESGGPRLPAVGVDPRPRNRAISADRVEYVRWGGRLIRRTANPPDGGIRTRSFGV